MLSINAELFVDWVYLKGSIYIIIESNTFKTNYKIVSLKQVIQYTLVIHN